MQLASWFGGGGMSKSFGLLQYGAEKIDYEVLPSPRRRTLGIEVHPDLRVVVRVPPGFDPDLVAARMGRRAKWISRQIERFRRFSPRTPPRHYVAGETHLYLGRQYRLKLMRGEVEGVKLMQGFIRISSNSDLSPVRVGELLRRWYRERARGLFDELLDERWDFFTRLGYTRPSVSVRTMSHRWGSLSRAGRMTLNSNLVRAPKACIEYVVLHELCHLVHKHHGPNFYRMLGKLMPDWEKRKQRLEQALL